MSLRCVWIIGIQEQVHWFWQSFRTVAEESVFSLPPPKKENPHADLVDLSNLLKIKEYASNFDLFSRFHTVLVKSEPGQFGSHTG